MSRKRYARELPGQLPLGVSVPPKASGGDEG